MAEENVQGQAVGLNQAYWSNLLDQLQKGGGDFLFLKPGKHHLRLVQPPKGERPFLEVKTHYRGKPRTKYMVLVVDMDEDEKKIRGALLARTAWQGIVSLLAEGFELFDADNGYGVTVIRSGSGLNTEYSVLPSRKPVPLPNEVRNQETPSLADTAQAYLEMQKKRESGKSESDEPPFNSDEGGTDSADW